VGDSRNAPTRTVPVGVRGTEEVAAGMDATLDLVRDGSVAQPAQERVRVRMVADKVTTSQQRGNQPWVLIAAFASRKERGQPMALRQGVEDGVDCRRRCAVVEAQGERGPIEGRR